MIAAASFALLVLAGPPVPRVVIVSGSSRGVDAVAQKRLRDAVRTGGERTRGFEFVVREEPCTDGSCVDAIVAESDVAAAVVVTVESEGRDYHYRLQLLDPHHQSVGTELFVEDTCEVCGLEEVGSFVEGSMATLLERYVRTLAPAILSLSSAPVGAEVLEEGKLIGNTPLRLELAPGEHTFKLQLPGYEPQQRTVSLGTGEALSVEAQLVRVPEPPRRWRPLAFSGAALLGLGIGSLVTGAALIAIDGRSKSCSEADANEAGVCPRRYATLEGGAVAVAIGGAAIITGVVFEVVASRRRARTRAAVHSGGLLVRF